MKNKKNKKSRLNKSLIVYILSLAALIFFLIFLISTNLIGYGVKENCQRAQIKYEGDCVEALISYMNDNNNDYRTRNSAVWALGQFGDERALPYLQNLYTGNIPDKEPLDKNISQYELRKAINLTDGGMNIGKPFWRFLLD